MQKIQKYKTGEFVCSYEALALSKALDTYLRKKGFHLAAESFLPTSFRKPLVVELVKNIRYVWEKRNGGRILKQNWNIQVEILVSKVCAWYSCYNRAGHVWEDLQNIWNSFKGFVDCEQTGRSLARREDPVRYVWLCVAKLHNQTF